jgi:hypothetical protein
MYLYGKIHAQLFTQILLFYQPIDFKPYSGILLMFLFYIYCCCCCRLGAVAVVIGASSVWHPVRMKTYNIYANLELYVCAFTKRVKQRDIQPRRNRK